MSNYPLVSKISNEKYEEKFAITDVITKVTIPLVGENFIPKSSFSLLINMKSKSEWIVSAHNKRFMVQTFDNVISINEVALAVISTYEDRFFGIRATMHLLIKAIRMQFDTVVTETSCDDLDEFHSLYSTNAGYENIAGGSQYDQSVMNVRRGEVISYCEGSITVIETSSKEAFNFEVGRLVSHYKLSDTTLN
ncbi:hypothetical protein [Aliivibrio fischeri]|uniref:hypothetical protein n=1 Tax=Aliivibrio fischeri TaxID=668 RepID=UPI0012D98D02|nr:hypothetical protein [Aliivibrio fischeri]MUJ20326.1 hypothetical protein [Aliivibrio fischeri]